jgi:ribosomal protein S27AE
MGLTVHVRDTPVAVDPLTIQGHPSVVLPNGAGDGVMISVCCECGALRSVLWLSKDRWACTKCRAVADNRPKMFPIA